MPTAYVPSMDSLRGKRKVVLLKFRAAIKNSLFRPLDNYSPPIFQGSIFRFIVLQCMSCSYSLITYVSAFSKLSKKYPWTCCTKIELLRIARILILEITHHMQFAETRDELSCLHRASKDPKVQGRKWYDMKENIVKLGARRRPAVTPERICQALAICL